MPAAQSRAVRETAVVARPFRCFQTHPKGARDDAAAGSGALAPAAQAPENGVVDGAKCAGDPVSAYLASRREAESAEIAAATLTRKADAQKAECLQSLSKEALFDLLASGAGAPALTPAIAPSAHAAAGDGAAEVAISAFRGAQNAAAAAHRTASDLASRAREQRSRLLGLGPEKLLDDLCAARELDQQHRADLQRATGAAAAASAGAERRLKAAVERANAAVERATAAEALASQLQVQMDLLKRKAEADSERALSIVRGEL